MKIYRANKKVDIELVSKFLEITYKKAIIMENDIIENNTKSE